MLVVPPAPVAPPADVLPPVVQAIVMHPLPLGTQRLQLALQQSSVAPHTAAPHFTPLLAPPVAALPPVAGAPPTLDAPPELGGKHSIVAQTPPVAVLPPADGAPPVLGAPPEVEAGHCGVTISHVPARLQNLSTAVSPQPETLGSQSVHESPHRFPAHGTYVLVLEAPPVLDEPPELEVHPKLSKVPAAQAQQLELSTGPPQ
jgi:hypothetical protein